MANASLVLFAGGQAGRLLSTGLFNPAQVAGVFGGARGWGRDL